MGMMLQQNEQRQSNVTPRSARARSVKRNHLQRETIKETYNQYTNSVHKTQLLPALSPLNGLS